MDQMLEDTNYVAPLSRVGGRRWSDRRWLQLMLLISDGLAIALGVLVAYVVRFQADVALFHESGDSAASFYTWLTLLMIPGWFAVFAVFRLYDFEFLGGGLDEYARAFNACTTGTMLIIFVSFLVPEFIVARGWLLLSWLTITALVILGRFLARRVVYRLRRRGRFLTRMLVVGADDEGRAIAAQLAGNQSAGIQILGFVDDQAARGSEVLPDLSVLGSTGSLRGLVHQYGVEELVVSAGALDRDRLLEIFRAFANIDEVKVRLSSGLFEILTTGVRVKDIGHVPLLSVNQVRLTGADVWLKKTLDYLGATLGMVALAPIFLVIAVVIKITSPGPLFHRRRVLGVGGKEFDAFKFRTMVVDADDYLARHPELLAEYEKNFKLKDDPRVTRFGAFLRKTSIDELPQLWNVLRGEMSLVGPRMIVKDEVAKYGKWGTNLLTVKPGITGLWQISGRSDIDYDGRVRLDMHYIRNYTVWLDLQILVQTIPSVLRREGAY
jgi:exopolysaccharide biosynthesis polyprenyl glycosylphosphotransferase